MSALLSEKQLCAQLCVTRPYLLKCRREGLPVIPLGNRHFRYDYDEVLSWLKNNKGVKQ